MSTFLLKSVRKLTYINRQSTIIVPANIIIDYVGHSSSEQLLAYAVKAGINKGEDFVLVL